MTKVSKEDEERGKKLIEEYKKAREEDKHPPVYVHQKDKWDLPPEESEKAPKKP